MTSRTKKDRYRGDGTPEVVCRTNKRGYRSQKTAAYVAAKVRRETGEWVSYYNCPQCHIWHIGHPPGLDTIPGPNFDPKTGQNPRACMWCTESVQQVPVICGPKNDTYEKALYIDTEPHPDGKIVINQDGLYRQLARNTKPKTPAYRAHGPWCLQNTQYAKDAAHDG